jgi:hypothetical protein
LRSFRDKQENLLIKTDFFYGKVSTNFLRKLIFTPKQDRVTLPKISFYTCKNKKQFQFDWKPFDDRQSNMIILVGLIESALQADRVECSPLHQSRLSSI